MKDEIRGLRFRFAAAILAYVLLIAVGVALRDRWGEAPAWLGVAIALVAALPAAAAVLVGPWMLRRQEGVERELLMRSASVAFFSTMVASLTYGLFEAFAAAPNLSAWWFYSLGMLAWLGISLVMQRRMA